MTACVCRILSTRFADGVSPSDGCSWPCKRISVSATFVLAKRWAAASSPFNASWLIVRWKTGSREWFFTTTWNVPTILCLHVTTVVVASNEDDVVTTICSDERRKKGTHVEQHQIHDFHQSQHACGRRQKVLWAYGLQRPVADVARVVRVLTLLEEAGGDEKLETRFQSSEAVETVSLSASAEKKQGCRFVHDWNVAVSCLFGGTIWPVANRLQAVRKHGTCWCWSGRPSSLPDHCH